MALRIVDMPTPPTTEYLYTVEEWLKMPVRRPYTELVDGKLVKMPSPSQNHWGITFNVSMTLQPYVLQHKLGRIGGEVNVIIPTLTPNNGWIPDLAFAAKDSTVKIGASWEGVPDWVLEVWAGTEKRSSRIKEKRERWQRAGVPELWEVIWRRNKQEVNVYHLEQGAYKKMPIKGDQICSQVIAGFCIERSAIFANLVEES